MQEFIIKRQLEYKVDYGVSDFDQFQYIDSIYNKVKFLKEQTILNTDRVYGMLNIINSIDILFSFKAVESSLENKIKRIHEVTTDTSSSDSETSDELNKNFLKRSYRSKIETIKEQGVDSKNSYSFESNTFTK